MKKIVHIIPILGCGGAEVLLGEIVKKQFELGNEIIICCLYPFHHSFDNYPTKKFLLENIDIQFINTRVKFSLKGKTKIIGNDYKELIDSFVPDIIHSHLYEAEIIAMSYIFKNAKYISHIHDNINQFKRFNTKDLFHKSRIATLKERKWLLKKYKQTQPVFLCVSEHVKGYIENNIPKLISNKAFCLPNAINLDRFINKETNRLNLNFIHIVSVGNLVTKKNHILLIEIAIVLKQKFGSNFKIDILGYGPLYSELLNRINKENLVENVFLRGSVGNVNEYYSEANLYVHTATYEPFGLVLIEAMASGLPVISLDGMGNRDIIRTGKNGILLKENNATLFAETILSVFNDKDYYHKLSKNGLEFSRDFGIEDYVARLHKIYTMI